MKVVHKNPSVKKAEAPVKKAEPDDWLIEAKELEQQGELEEAAAAYEKAIKEKPKNEFAHDRLMIIYRKEKEYKKELAVINRAIKIFEEVFKSHSRHTGNKKLASISKSLLKSLDMADSKGQALYKAGPLSRWNKRKKVVEKKIKR